jgi:hypothetical protein
MTSLALVVNNFRVSSFIFDNLIMSLVQGRFDDIKTVFESVSSPFGTVKNYFRWKAQYTAYRINSKRKETGSLAGQWFPGFGTSSRGYS